ncbi:hypothetical protein GCM10010106_27200 [Thermopolyspora flexuosa]|jgi:hypothetical protein|uniref:Uncharacterized protein n=1 Tax=Thermopolyspora flexuosa TaxID=103836 RepID=A0A543IW68_9ACTN|nr:hypothetical protein [Thermopolyspora flexuosa]TQM74820.1 hypothetical protein FHX40_1504 [Thermopolyspora flexuosa]GGM79201.1 hypothetical protein GCM10010106_27200 [Thermopolyspora flexuosa]
MPDDRSGLEEELRRAAGMLDPVPEHLLRQAVSAYAWHTVDAEPAELTFDSHAPEQAALVRGPGAPRLLTFESATVTVEVEITECGDARRLTGRITPPRPAGIEVRRPDRRLHVQADELGRFSCEGLPAGPLGLRCSTAEQTVVTDWVAI